MLRRYGAGARSARARRSYDRIMDDAPLPEPAEARRSRHSHVKYPPFWLRRLSACLSNFGVHNGCYCSALPVCGTVRYSCRDGKGRCAVAVSHQERRSWRNDTSR